MRPVRLAIENFGPYRERAEIDFSRLGDFFLICGKTGSGKSTLFDAMTYALFGKAPGARDGLEGELASDFSAPGDRPLVEFEFELSGSGFCVERVAPHQRPKRGGGLTEVPASAVLRRKSGDSWLPVAEGVKEVGAKVSSLVGLSADEFSKVILLPQGAFQNFLDMKTSDRALVLEKLFPVAIYDTITELSKRKAEAAKAALASLDAEIGRISTEEGEDAEARAADTERELAAALGAEKAASEALKAAERRLEAERERAARADRALQAAHALAELEEKKAVADARLERISKARAAAAAQPAITLFNKERLDLADAELKLGAARAEVEDLESRISGDGDLGARIADAEAAITAKRTDFFNVQRGLEAWRRRAEALSRAQAAEVAALDAKNAVAALVSGMEMLKTELEQSRISLEGESALRLELEGLEARTRLLERMGQLAGRIDSNNAEIQRIDGDRVVAAAKFEAVENARRSARDELGAAESRAAAQAAARLADKLVPGQACPVCGSTDHPLPAIHPQSPKTDDASNETEAARELLIGLSGDSASLSTKLSHLSERRDALLAEVGKTEIELSGLALSIPGTPSETAEIEAFVEECSSKISVLRGALEALNKKRSTYESGARSLETQRAGLETAQSVAARAESEVGVARVMVAEAERESGAEDPEPAFAQVSAELKTLQAAKEGMEGAKAAFEKNRAASHARLETLGRACAEKIESFALARTRLFSALRASGFLGQYSLGDMDAGLREAGLAALPPSVLEAEERAANEYNEALAGARAKADSLKADLPKVNNWGQTPFINFESETAAARAALDAARVSSDSLRLALDRLRDAIGRRDAAVERRRLLFEAAQKLHALSSLLRGDLPGRKLPFKNFVLAMYFREVIARASSHLSLMSDGRYYLRPEDTSSPVSGKGRIGLGLKVVDMWTGGERPTGTLSGGEKFLTAISLALGLADTIRDRNGGVSLDSVFIDEGFGSLDEEALDRAISVLDKIRGSRTIGIVSHVQGLRTRIPARIEVEKTPSGSKVSQVFGIPDQA